MNLNLVGDFSSSFPIVLSPGSGCPSSPLPGVHCSCPLCCLAQPVLVRSLSPRTAAFWKFVPPTSRFPLQTLFSSARAQRRRKKHLLTRTRKLPAEPAGTLFDSSHLFLILTDSCLQQKECESGSNGVPLFVDTWRPVPSLLVRSTL